MREPWLQGVRNSLLIVVLAFVASWSGAAWAARDEAKAHFDKGRAEYDLGHFAEACRAFEEAYRISRDPILLFNIAQSYRQSGDPEKAIFFYSRFLRADPESALRSKVEARIHELEKLVDTQKAEREKPPIQVEPPSKQDGTGEHAKGPSTTETPAGPDANRGVGTPAPSVPLTAARDADDSRRRHRARTGSLVVGGLGVAAGITGAVLVGMAWSKLDAIQEDGVNDRPYDSSNGNYRAFEVAGFTLLAVGVTALAAGTIGYFHYREREQSASSVSFLLGPDHAGLSLTGRF